MKGRFIAAALALSLLHAAGAPAKDSAMVLDFDGKQERALHDRVVKALKKAGVALSPPDHGGGPKDDGAREAVHKKRGVLVFVEGSTAVSKKGIWTLSLTTHGGGSGAEGELSLEGRSVAALFKKIDAEVPEFVKEKLSASNAAAPEPEPEEKKKAEPEPEEKKPEPEEEPAKAEKKQHDEDEKEEKEHSAPSPRPSPLSLALGVRVFSRDFSYREDVNTNLRPYKLDAAPSVFAALGWYPGAHFTSGAGAHVGLVGDFEQSLFAKSVLDASGAKYSTSMRAFSVGLRARFPLDPHELGLSLKFGSHAFDIKGDSDPAALSAAGAPVQRDLVPNVAYTYLRPALDARFAFGAFGIGAGVGYRVVLSAGDAQKDAWFPNAKVSALDAGVFVSYDVARSLGLFLGVDLRRYGYSMHSKPTDLGLGRDVAGGAIDQYLSAFIGAEYRLPGG